MDFENIVVGHTEYLKTCHMSDLYQTFKIGPLIIAHIIINVQLHTILQISCQERSTSSKPQSNSLAELSLYQHIGQNTCHVLGASQPVDG